MTTRIHDLYIVRNGRGDMLAGHGKYAVPKLYMRGHAVTAANLHNKYLGPNLDPDLKYYIIPVTINFGEPEEVQ